MKEARVYPIVVDPTTLSFSSCCHHSGSFKHMYEHTHTHTQQCVYALLKLQTQSGTCGQVCDIVIENTFLYISEVAPGRQLVPTAVRFLLYF